MSGPGGVAGDRLRAFVERIERLEEEIKQLSDDKKDVYAEAKGDGFDVKILKEVIRLRKQDKNERDERDSLLDVYLHAIETAPAKMEPAASRVAARTQIRPAEATIGQSARERRTLVRSMAPSDEITAWSPAGFARPET